MMESYSEIENRMFEKYKELTGCDCHDASDISIKIKLLAGELFNLQSSITWLNNQLFPQTATSRQLEYHADLRGLKRKNATKSTGVLRFSLPEPATSTVVIPSGTMCSTAGKNPVRFITTSTASIEVGFKMAIANAYAVVAGSEGNVAPNTVTVITSSVNSQLSVTNLDSFSGGSDTESDESLRNRIIDDIKSPSTGTNKAYYKRLAESVDGVYSANVVPRVRGNGTVDIYIASHGATIGSEYVAQVQSLMDSERELNVDVLVSAAATNRVSVSLSLIEKNGYDFEEVKAAVTEKLQEYFLTLHVGEIVYVSNLGKIIGGVEGVDSFLFRSTSLNNLAPSYNQLLVLGNTYISQG